MFPGETLAIEVRGAAPLNVSFDLKQAKVGDVLDGVAALAGCRLFLRGAGLLIAPVSQLSATEANDIKSEKGGEWAKNTGSGGEGWAFGETLESTLVETAWQRALQTRDFASGQGPELYHSDRGSQYASRPFRNLLAASNTQDSMSGTGECLDNAVAERFLGTLKAELVGDQPGARFERKRPTWELVGDYMDNFYNLVRRHSALGYKSPIASKWRCAPNNEQTFSPWPLYQGTLTLAIGGAQRAPGFPTSGRRAWQLL